MTDVQQRASAKEFAAYWKNRGDEKQETQRFWIDLLRNVYVDCAIVYPAESAILYDKFAPIEELFSRKRVGKVFIIVNKNMSLCECGNLQKYVDCTLELNDTRARC